MFPAAAPDSDRLHVLLVEDDERSGRMLGRLLRREGFEVEVCPGGPSGLQRLSCEPAPDVLVTDLRMPQVDGVAVARHARRHSPAIPILIVTAYPDLARGLEDARPELQLFIKPLDLPALVASLRSIHSAAHA